MYKLQVDEQDNDLWHDVNGSDGKPLTFSSESEARQKLNEMFPVLVKMEQYAAGPKRTRVISILKDDDEDEQDAAR